MTTLPAKCEWPDYILRDFSFADFPRGARVLDLGFGSGDQLRELIASGCRAVGVDFDHGLARAGRGAGLTACQAAAEALPFASGVFDGVVCKVVFPIHRRGTGRRRTRPRPAPGRDCPRVVPRARVQPAIPFDRTTLETPALRCACDREHAVLFRHRAAPSRLLGRYDISERAPASPLLQTDGARVQADAGAAVPGGPGVHLPYAPEEGVSRRVLTSPTRRRRPALPPDTA